MRKLTKRITAMLLAGMLVIGSVPGSVFAASTDVDPGQTSEIAEEVYDEESSEAPAGEGETAEIEETSEAPAASGDMSQVEETSEAPAGEGEMAEIEETSEAPVAVGETAESGDTSEASSTEEEATVQYYTVTLDANGGYFENEWDDAVGDYVERAEVIGKQIPVGGTVAAVPVFSDQDGQTMLFAGWSLERDGELVWQAEEENIPLDNCVLYAVWQAEDAALGESGEQEVADGTELNDTAQETDTAEEPEDSDAIEETEVVLGQEDDEDIAETGTGFEETEEAESAQELAEFVEEADTARETADTELEESEDVNIGDDAADYAEEFTSSDALAAPETAVLAEEDTENSSDSAATGAGAQHLSRQGTDSSAGSSADATGSQEVIESEGEEETAVSNPLFAAVQTPSNGDRYTVLLIDTSGSMNNDSRLVIAKQAAIKFCEQMLAADGVNYISVVSYASSVLQANDFTNQLALLKSQINSMSANGGTNTNAAFLQASALLNTAPTGSDKNIVLLSDGLPESGDSLATGRYTSNDHNNYKYGNMVYKTVKALDSSWNIYTLGFFQGLSGLDLSFGRKLMQDIQNHGFFDVKNADELDFAFETVFSDILYKDISLDGPFTAEDGDDIRITATLVSQEGTPNLSEISWSCEPELLTFSNKKLEGPEVTGKVNTWRLSVDADVMFPEVSGKKTGSVTTHLKVMAGEQYAVSAFTITAQTVYKAEKNGFPVCNSFYGFGLPNDYCTPFLFYVEAMSGDAISAGTMEYGALAMRAGQEIAQFIAAVRGCDEALWKGDCAAMALLSAAEYEGKVQLKHTYFLDQRGSVLAKYGYQEKKEGYYSIGKDTSLFHFIEKIQCAQCAQQLRNCRVFKNDDNYQNLIQELESGNGKPYVVIIKWKKGAHTVVIDPSKPVEPLDNGDGVCVRIYDPDFPSAGYPLDNPKGVYVDYSTNSVDIGNPVPFLCLMADGTANICWPNEKSGGSRYIPAGDFVDRRNINFYDISRIDENFFKGATFLGNTRGVFISDFVDMTWDTSNNLTIRPNGFTTSNQDINFGIFSDLKGGDADESAMYYFDADAAQIEYESPLSAVMLINDEYPDAYCFTNNGMAQFTADLETHSVSALALEDGADITVASIVDEYRDDAFMLKFTLTKDQKITVVQEDSFLSFTKETVDGDNTASLEPVVVQINYTNSNREECNELTVDSTEEYILNRSGAQTVPQTIIASGNLSSSISWTLNDSNVLMVQGSGNMPDQWGSNPWGEYGSRIEKAVIDTGITGIGEQSFYYCTNMKSIKIPKGVKYIGKGAFMNCWSLKSVSIPEGVTYIDYSTFHNCNSLETLKIPCSVTGIDSAVGYCENLRTVYYAGTQEKWNRITGGNSPFPENVSIIFSSAEEPNSIVDSGTCGSRLTWEYYNSGNLIISGYGKMDDWSTSGFHENPPPWNAYAGNIKTVEIKKGVTGIGAYAFELCTGMESIVIPEGVTSIGDYAFKSCLKLSNILLPSSLTSIGESVFAYCIQLVNVTIPSGITDIPFEAFHGCSGLQSVTISEGTMYASQWAFAACPNLERVIIPRSFRGFGYETFVGGSKQKLVIYCYSDSVAKAYAKNENIPYILLDAKSISDAVVSIDDVTYTGAALTPSPVVKLDGTPLVENTDYTLQYSNNINAGTGSVTVKGMENYKDTVKKTFLIKKASQSIAAENLSLSYGDSAEIAVSGVHGHLQYTSSDKNIASVDTEGKVYAGEIGTATVTILAEETENYYSASKNITVTVSKAEQGISIEASVDSLRPGESADLSVSGAKGEVAFVSSDQNLATVDKYGTIIAKNVGTVVITALAAETGYYKKGAAECRINIMPIAITSASVTGIEAKTYTGSSITQIPKVTLNSTVLKSGTDYTVSFRDNINAGTATVTVTGKGNYTGSKNTTFKINKAAQSITAKAAACSVAVGKTTTVSITGAKGTKSYKSSDTTIAAVTSAGKVTAKKVGTVKITATSAATSNYNSASKTVTIKVVPAATTSLTAANQATGIKLTWKKVTGANGYKVYRGATLIKTITSGSTVTFADTKANTNGTKYTFKIVAKATTGDSTLSKSVTVYRVVRPAISSATNSAASKMTVKWGKNAKANGYQIQYSTDKTFKSGIKSVSVTSVSTVSRVIGSLTKGKTYYVRIRTYKTVGSAKYWSEWSAVKSVKINK